MRKVAAFYSILIGVAVIGMWSMIIATQGIQEGSFEISFHLVSEFAMAILLIAGGIGILGSKFWSGKVFFIANGMLVYSVLNAAGYYGQRNNWAMTGVFIAICSALTLLLIIMAGKKE